ncbi:MAG: hypothetical protein ACYDAE_21350 [Steroidobacteraceae bacterium]
MLDEFLKVAYAQELTKQSNAELEGMLSKLPFEELRKLADGTPAAELYKEAYCNPPGDAKMGDGTLCFLDRFKGTPLFDQAMALEQEELQIDMLQQQRDEERRAEGDVWQMRDKLRLKKRLLELTLAKQEAGGAPPGEPAQGAGAPGPVPAEGVQDDSQGLGGGVAKMGNVAELFEFADGLGRELAHHNFAKAAHAQQLEQTGRRAGEALAKIAGIGELVGKGLGMALTHPTAAGAALGAAGGALAGGKDHRLSGALGGAALGAGAGRLAAPSINKGLTAAVTHGVGGGSAGGMLGAGAKAFGQDAAARAQGAFGKVRGMLGAAPPVPAGG